MKNNSKPFHVGIITGATGGIGKSLSVLLARYTGHLHLLGRNEKKLIRLKEELTKAHTEITLEKCDFSRINDLPSFSGIDNKQMLIKPSIIVNCAGIYSSGKFEDKTPKNISDEFFINVVKHMQITSELCNSLASGSIIINIGSYLSYTPMSNHVVSSATKHALRGFSLSLSNELSQKNIRVTLINPKSVATQLLEKNTTQEKFKSAMPVDDICNAVMTIITSNAKTNFTEINVGSTFGFLGK